MTVLSPPPSRGSVEQALARDRLGVWSVVFFVMSAATPLTVVAGIVTTGYAVTGLVGLPVAFVVVAAVLALFSVGFVAMARHVANAGAFYSYVAHGLGRPAGVGAAWVALLAYNALQVGLYGIVGVAAAPVLSQWLDADVAWWVVALAAWALVAVLGVQQVDVNGRVLAVLLLAEVAIIVVYSVAAVAHPADGTVSFDGLAPSGLTGAGVGAVLALAVLGFVGFESSVVFAEESREPGRTVRVATFTSIALIAAVYTLASWAMGVATGPERIVDAARELSAELIFAQAQAHLGSTWVDVGRVLFVTSVVAAMISFHNTAARYMFALGREQVLPAALGRTARRSGAPVVGSAVQSVIALVVIVVYAAGGWDPLVQLFFWGGTSGALGILLLIAATSIAVVVFLARTPGHGENAWRAVVAPLLAAVAVLAVLALAVANFATLLGVDESSPLRWGVPLLYAATAVLGALWALVLRSRRRDVYVGVGRGARSTVTRADGRHAGRVDGGAR